MELHEFREKVRELHEKSLMRAGGTGRLFMMRTRLVRF